MAKGPKIFNGGLKSEHPVYIGIDQSYSGFAITALDAENKSDYYSIVYKAEGSGVDRLKGIQAFVMDVLTEFTIVDVAMEGYAFGSQMANMLGELGGMVKMTLRDFGVYPLIVPPTNLKKYVTGKGNGVSKSQMLLYVFRKWGADITDDNAADSYALAKLVSGAHVLEYEKEVYDKLQDPKFRER
jgi:Holliday junction resolvasome RuvABC endonuclease subunit